MGGQGIGGGCSHPPPPPPSLSPLAFLFFYKSLKRGRLNLARQLCGKKPSGGRRVAVPNPWRRDHAQCPGMCKRLEEDALVETALQFYAAAVAGNCAPRGLSYGWIGRVGQGKGGGPAAMGGLDGEDG